MSVPKGLPCFCKLIFETYMKGFGGLSEFWG